MNQSPSEFHSGFVAIVGLPNVGKSTLLNALLGFKLSIVTPKPQTTRESVLGILNQKNCQMIFLDTPGWLNPNDPFQSFLKRSINRSIFDDADVLLWLLDPKPLSPSNKTLGEILQKSKKPIFVAVNKMDQKEENKISPQLEDEIKQLLTPSISIDFISAKTKKGVTMLKEKLISSLPKGSPYYPQDQVTNRWERYYVCELIREKIFDQFEEEVPHACAVRVDEYKERSDEKDYIRATIFVETEGQKRILVGKKGQAIRQLSQSSREEIQKQLSKDLYLEINVKTKKSWRKDAQFIKNLHESYE